MEKRPSYQEQFDFFKSIGYRPTGFDFTWTNGETSIKINFFSDKTEIIPLVK